MITIKVPEVGDVVSLRRFAFTNKSGGTGLSDWQYDPRFAVALLRRWLGK